MPEDDKMLILPLGEESKIITQTIANDTARKILELLAENPMSTSNIAKRLDIPLTTAQYNIEKLMEAGLVVVEKTKYSEKGREVKLYAPAKRMIVLVPKTASSQSLIDALKKYLVLLPIAAVASVFVELAMRFQAGTGILGERLSVGGSLMTSKSPGDAGNDLQMATMNNTYTYYTGSPDTLPAAVPMPTANELARNLSDPAVSLTAVDNATKVGGAAGQAASAPGNASLPPVVQADTGAIQSLIPYDLLNHWGLWFLTGCLLIICIMAAYDLYTRRKGGKK